MEQKICKSCGLPPTGPGEFAHKKSDRMRRLIYIGIFFGAVACNRPAGELRTGDLLFQVGRESAMSGAIQAATGRDEGLNFTHVGIAVIGGRADSVLEATSEGGVRMTAMSDFLKKSATAKGRPLVVAKRLKDTSGVAASVRRARTFLGQPYDCSFRPDNGRMYCSELVWESFFRPDGRRIFPARPMNFRAADGSMPAFWTELFEKSGEAIPEGVPGTNPDDLARDPQLGNPIPFF